ncbi:LysM domain-containing protein [Paramyrothecium foliicola]|nr:LysM domain-containing protein [Paramyrothecium foliicola]
MKSSILAIAAFAFARTSLAVPTAVADAEATGTALPPVPPTFTGPNGVATPLPMHPGIVDNCDSFHLVEQHQTCQGIARSHRVVESDLINWQPFVGPQCLNIWAGYHACVRTIGYTPTVVQTCYSEFMSGKKLWGDNEIPAIRALLDWCNSMTDDLISEGQTLYACHNARYGVNRFRFEITNPRGTNAHTVLTPAMCKRLLAIPVEGCDRGGYAETEGWQVE